MLFSSLNTGNTDLRDTDVQHPNTEATFSLLISSRAFSANSGQFEAGSTTTASSFLPSRPPFLFCSAINISITSFSVVSLMAMVPESECRMPTLIVSWAVALWASGKLASAATDAAIAVRRIKRFMGFKTPLLTGRGLNQAPQRWLRATSVPARAGLRQDEAIPRICRWVGAPDAAGGGDFCLINRRAARGPIKAKLPVRKAPCAASSDRWRRLEPDVVVVKGCPAIGAGLIGAGQGIDALAALELIVGGDAFHDHDAADQPREGLDRQHDFAPLVAHAHPPPIRHP